MVRRMALEAGEIIMEYYENLDCSHIDTKSDSSPVTHADREAEAYIQKALAEILPGIPVIGEEAVSMGAVPDISAAEYFWLVDPLDGTKEFIRGSQDFTVNIGLIHNKAPVLGVVYAPAKGELYAGYGKEKAIRWLEDSGKEKEISVRPAPAEGLTVVSSRSHGNPEVLEKFLGGYKVARVTRLGSSLKICEIAAGRADIYPRFGPTCEWDTAAAHAVLAAAGGVVTDLQGRDLAYGGADPKFLNPHFVAGAYNWLLEEDGGAL